MNRFKFVTNDANLPGDLGHWRLCQTARLRAPQVSKDDAHISWHAVRDGDHLGLPQTTDKASRLNGGAAALVAEDVHAVRQEEAESRGRSLATPLQKLWQLGEYLKTSGEQSQSS